MSECKVCGGKVFGYGGDIRIPLCKEHYVKTIQLACYYFDRVECPYEGTEAEWDAVAEIVEARKQNEIHI